MNSFVSLLPYSFSNMLLEAFYSLYLRISSCLWSIYLYCYKFKCHIKKVGLSKHVDSGQDGGGISWVTLIFSGFNLHGMSTWLAHALFCQMPGCTSQVFNHKVSGGSVMPNQPDSENCLTETACRQQKKTVFLMFLKARVQTLSVTWLFRKQTVMYFLQPLLWKMFCSIRYVLVLFFTVRLFAFMTK